MHSRTTYRLCSLLLMLGLWGSTWAQSNRLIRLYHNLEFEKAAPKFEKSGDKNNDRTSYSRAGECYERASLHRDAARCFLKASAGSNPNRDDLFRAGKNLKAIGQYSKAKKCFLQYGELSGDALGYEHARSCDAAKELRADSLNWKVSVVDGLNSKWSEIAPVWYKGGVLLASNRPRGFFARFLSGRGGLPFYDLYHSQRLPDGRLSSPEYQSNGLNFRYHDGPVAFTPAEDQAFLTRSNTEKGKIVRDGPGYNHLGIYQSRQEGQEWQKAVPFDWNHQDYNVAHAAVSSDGNTLYFVSDRPSGQGRSDIYVSQREAEGKWSEPRNMGPDINSSGEELFLYLKDDNTLYFASDRAEGLGGLDIFSVQRKENGRGWMPPRNEGYPLNSYSDDFGIAFIPGSNRGYFSSNRPGGPGKDNIWQFRRYMAYEGIVVDARTGEALPNTIVKVYDSNLKEHSYQTDLNGRFRYTVKSGKLLKVRIDREGYLSQEKKVDLRQADPARDYEERWALFEDKKLEVVGRVLVEGGDHGIPNANLRIITDTDDFNIRADEAGSYQHELQLGQEYTMIFSAPGYAPVVQDLRTLSEMEPISFRVDAELSKTSYVLVEGVVLDKEKEQPLKGTLVRILATGTQQKLGEGSSRSDGRFYIPVDTNSAYSIIASQEGYLTTRRDLDTLEFSGDRVIYEKMELSPIGENQVFKIVYYDYDGTGIDALGKRDLNEITYFLEDNPRISVSVESHTDSRGGGEYNLELSQKRSEAVRSYLIRRGIARERLIAKGMGESQLVNGCSDGKKCPEALHALNRRTELKAVDIQPLKEQR